MWHVGPIQTYITETKTMNINQNPVINRRKNVSVKTKIVQLPKTQIVHSR